MLDYNPLMTKFRVLMFLRFWGCPGMRQLTSFLLPGTILLLDFLSKRVVLDFIAQLFDPLGLIFLSRFSSRLMETGFGMGCTFTCSRIRKL